MTVVMAGAEVSSSDFSSSILGTPGASEDKSFKIFLEKQRTVSVKIKVTFTGQIQRRGKDQETDRKLTALRREFKNFIV